MKDWVLRDSLLWTGKDERKENPGWYPSEDISGHSSWEVEAGSM